MKNFKWINLSLLLLLVLLTAYQVGNASAKSGLPAPSPAAKIKSSELPKSDLEGMYQKATALTDKFASTFMARPGKWIHWSAVIANDPDEPMVYPNGSIIPPTTVHEAWYTLNSAGFIQEGLYLVKDPDGNVIQQVVYRDNISYNLTFSWLPPTKMTADNSAPATSFDFHFANELRKMIDAGTITRAAQQTASAAGQTSAHQPDLKMTIEQDYQEPLTISGMAAPVQSVSTRIGYDSRSGASNQIETSYHLTNGEDLTSIITVTTLEKVEILPTDIQQLQELMSQSIQRRGGNP
ncbi:MAG: hypothetical protein PHQ40_12320 [Anaerolineaceae bacterium]|nr:hypothetical protein [Anaerolineaceae bacterium]